MHPRPDAGNKLSLSEENKTLRIELVVKDAAKCFWNYGPFIS